MRDCCGALGNPVPLTHRKLAENNFSQADAAPSSEWKVTMYFYAALHAVNHHEFGARVAPLTFRHEDRDALIAIDPRYQAIESPYRQLKGLATTARYLPKMHPMSSQQVDAARTYAEQVFKHVAIKVP